MIETLPSPDDVVAVRISGKVDKEQWEQVTTLLEEKLDDHEHVRMYGDMTALDGVSVGAVLEDMKFSLTNLGDLSRIRRAAVVTDGEWMERAGDLGAKIVPGMEFRAFDSGEEAEALRWVSE